MSLVDGENLLLGVLIYVGLLFAVAALVAFGDGRLSSPRKWLEQWQTRRRQRRMWGNWAGDWPAPSKRRTRHAVGAH